MFLYQVHVIFLMASWQVACYAHELPHYRVLLVLMIPNTDRPDSMDHARVTGQTGSDRAIT